MKTLSAQWPWGIVGACFLFWWIWKKNWLIVKVFLVGALAVVVADMLAYQLFKPSFGRLRPCKEYLFIRLIDGCGGTFSFPSNHATNFMVVCIFVMRWSRGFLPWLALILTFLVGISRVYLGVHYLTDILAGFFLGAWFGCGGVMICEKYLMSKTQKCP